MKENNVFYYLLKNTVRNYVKSNYSNVLFYK